MQKERNLDSNTSVQEEKKIKLANKRIAIYCRSCWDAGENATDGGFFFWCPKIAKKNPKKLEISFIPTSSNFY